MLRAICILIINIQEGTKYVLDQYGPSAAGRVHYITWQLPAPEVNDCCLLRSSCQVESSRRVFLPKLAAGELWRVGKEVQIDQMKGKYVGLGQLLMF